MWALLIALRRRWWLVGTGVVVGVLLALLAGQHARGAYWGQINAVFIAPAGPKSPNGLSSATDSLIGTAGIVERSIVGGRTELATSSDAVNILDGGTLDGWTVRLPNSGGQWASNFDQPVLEIQASGPTASRVQENLAIGLAQVQGVLDRVQTDSHVAEESRITILASPSEPNIVYVPAHGSRAAVVVAVLSVATSVGLTASLARRSRGRESEVRTRMREVANA